MSQFHPSIRVAHGYTRDDVEMGAFRVADHGDRYVLTDDFRVVVDGLEIVVPAGCDTDFSSVPRYLQWAMDFRKVDAAGVVHDWLYKIGVLPRKRSDRIWRLIARHDPGKRKPRKRSARLWRFIAGTRNSVWWHQGALGWLALRVGGWHAWRSHRRRDT